MKNFKNFEDYENLGNQKKNWKPISNWLLK